MFNLTPIDSFPLKWLNVLHLLINSESRLKLRFRSHITRVLSFDPEAKRAELFENAQQFTNLEWPKNCLTHFPLSTCEIIKSWFHVWKIHLSSKKNVKQQVIRSKLVTAATPSESHLPQPDGFI